MIPFQGTVEKVALRRRGVARVGRVATRAEDVEEGDGRRERT